MFCKSFYFFEISKMFAWMLLLSWVFSDYNLLGDIALLQNTSVRSLVTFTFHVKYYKAITHSGMQENC